MEKKYLKTQALMAVLIIIDQLAKIWATSFLKDSPVVLINKVLELIYTENRGAAFGIFQDGRWFFIIVSVLIIFAIGYVFYRMPDDKRYNALRIILVFIMAGAAGNLIDRIIRGFVVDFIYFMPIDFPVFNLADIFITCGTIVLIIYILFFTKDDYFDFLKKNKEEIVEKDEGDE